MFLYSPVTPQCSTSLPVSFRCYLYYFASSSLFIRLALRRSCRRVPVVEFACLCLASSNLYRLYIKLVKLAVCYFSRAFHSCLVLRFQSAPTSSVHVWLRFLISVMFSSRTRCVLAPSSRSTLCTANSRLRNGSASCKVPFILSMRSPSPLLQCHIPNAFFRQNPAS